MVGNFFWKLFVTTCFETKQNSEHLRLMIEKMRKNGTTTLRLVRIRNIYVLKKMDLPQVQAAYHQNHGRVL